MKEEKTALIIIDMQADYIGKKIKNSYYSNGLIERINERIAFFQEQEKAIIYVKNVGRRKKVPYVSDFVQGLSISSDNIVLKEKASMLSNTDLLNFLKQHSISQLEIVGIDGNCCVAHSALDASNCGFSVVLSLKYIGIKDIKRFENTKEKLTKANVIIIEE